MKKIKNGSAKISQNKQMQMRRKAGGKSAARKVHVNKDRQRQLSRAKKKKKKKQYFRIPLAASKPGKHMSIFDKISWHPDEMQVSGAPSGRI